jgi:6-phosphogluconolactonase
MLKKAAALLLVCASIGAWLGCGTTSSRYLYAAIPGGPGGGEIVAYREDPNAGVLTQLAGSPIQVGGAVHSLAIHPSGKYLYAANPGTSAGPGNISLFTISNTGALTEVTPRTAAGNAPTLLVMDQSGSFLYAANIGSEDISVYSIDSGSGALTPVPQTSGATAPVGLSALNMVLTPSGTSLYITGAAGSAQSAVGIVEQFVVNQGVLSPPPAPQQNTFLAGRNPNGLVIDPGGAFLYTANNLDNTISEFSINSDGSLTGVSGSPLGESFTIPTALLIDKSGKYLYVANQGSSNVAAYSLGSSGGLTLLASSPFGTGASPTVLATDSSGKFFFVGNQTSPAIQSFTLDPSSGTLTSVASYAVGATPTSIVITP